MHNDERQGTGTYFSIGRKSPLHIHRFALESSFAVAETSPTIYMGRTTSPILCHLPLLEIESPLSISDLGDCRVFDLT